MNEKSAKATPSPTSAPWKTSRRPPKEEGALNVIALPHDWSNYGEVIESFKKKYPEIKVTELNPNASSKEELDAAKTNKHRRRPRRLRCRPGHRRHFHR